MSNNGEWWSIPWWNEEKYYQDNQFSKEEVETVFNKLKIIFDAGWMLKQDTIAILGENVGCMFKQKEKKPPHMLARFLLTRGAGIFMQMMRFGKEILELEKSGLLTEDFLIRLKDANLYLGASFELIWFYDLLSKGFCVELNYLSGKEKKNCDFRVSKGEEVVFMELKNLELSKFNEDIPYGEPLSQEAEIKKLQKKMMKYKNQLPDIGPGVFLIKTFFPLGFFKYLFSVEESLKNGLNQNKIPESLQNKFQEHKIFLSQNSSIKVIEADSKWEISDQEEEFIIKEEGRTLNIYDFTLNQNLSNFLGRQNLRHISGVFCVFLYLDSDARLHYKINFIKNPKANIDISSYEIVRVLDASGQKDFVDPDTSQ